MFQRKKIYQLLLIGCGLAPALGLAASCYVPMKAKPQQVIEDDGTIRITAEQSESKGRDYIHLKGDVELIHGGRLLKSQEATFDRQQNQVKASGGIELTEQNLHLEGESAEIDIQGEAARITGGGYQIMGQPGRGQAEEITIHSREKITLTGASYTTCPPGSDDWMIRASDIGLLPEDNEGYAKHMRLEVGGVPVIYLPYINFPLGKRKTGLLAPSIGSSTTTGDETRLPFYWNIAPDRDATITPRHMSKRGTQLQTEFRYLNPNNSGKLYFELLPNDELEQQDRGYITYEHSARWDNWQTQIEWNQVSDINYLRELATGREEVSASFLNRKIAASYLDDNLWASASLLDNQLLDETLTPKQHPFSQLPRLEMAYTKPVADYLQFDLLSEFVHFERNDSLTASRLDLEPAITVPWQREWGFVKPQFAFRETLYWLDQQQLGSDDTPSRQQPRANLDAGIWLERDFSLGEGRYQQTLEPRIYYTYIPYRAQSDLVRDLDGQEVIFDSTEREFNFENLFTGNRYTGADRVGDAKQIAAALGSRIYDDQGRQLLHVRVGQIYYIDLPKVTLPGEAAETRDQSNLLAELDGRIGERWHTTAFAEWLSQDEELQTARMNIGYQADIKRKVDLSLNYRRGSAKQGSLLARWPLAKYWSVMTDVTHSFSEDQTRNATVGLEYEDCCWSLRVATRRYISDNDGTFNNAFAVQFELKGLASVGTKISGFAESDTRNITDVEN